MDVDDYIVEVRDGSYIRQGQLVDSDLVDFLAVPRANNIGSWQVVLPQNVLTDTGEIPHSMCELLRAPGSGLVVTNARTGLVEISGPLTNAVHAADTTDPGGTWTLTGVSDTTVIAESEAWPDPTDADPAYQDVANDVRTAPAETLIHQFVGANIGPSATTARKNTRLTLGANLGRGPTLTKSPRFTNLLTLCQEITTGTNLLFDVVQIGDQLQLRTWEADDLTADIRMDLENGQLASANYEYARPTLTHVNVLGQDQGVNRQVITRTSAESLAAAALWGVRIERSIDQRNTDDIGELEQSGDEALAEEGRTTTSLRVVPSGDQTDNFSVGDFVTIVVGGQEVHAQVTEMPIAINADGVFVGCTVGDPRGFDWESLLVSRQSAQEKRISRIERTVEVPASLYSQAEVDALVTDVLVRARRRNVVTNGNFRVNQRGYTSGAALGSRAYGFDMWQCAGILNLDTNPNFEAASTGWSAFNGSAQSKSTAQFRSGAASMAITRSGSGDDYVGKTYTGLTAGKRYRLSAWVRVTGTGATASGRAFSVVINGAVSTTPWPTTANVWQRVSIDFIADATSVAARLHPMTGQTVYIDDVMLTEGTALWPAHDGGSTDSVWTGSAHASTSRRGPASGAATFTVDPHGQTITLAADAGIMQVIEQASVDAGEWILSFVGTATARVYNVGTAPSSLPAFADSGSVWNLDGLDDVVLEFRAVGATKTVGAVQLERGTVVSPYEVMPVGDELDLCQRNYQQVNAVLIGHNIGVGVVVSTTRLSIPVQLTRRMRAVPALTMSSGVNWEVRAATAFNVTAVSYGPASTDTQVTLDVDTAGGMTAGQAGILRSRTATGQWLGFSADF